MNNEDQPTITLAIREVLNTRESRQLLSVLIPELLRVWADKNRLKNKVSGPLEKLIQSGFSPELNVTYASLVDDPETLSRLSRLLPWIVSTASEAALNVASTAEKLAVEEKEKLAAGVFSREAFGHIGRLVTLLARMLGDIHEKNPAFLTRTVEPGFRKFIEAIDFGELRDAMDTAAGDVDAFAKMINDIMWQYPAKLVLCLSFVPDLVNAIVVVMKESIHRFNQTSPDIVADIALSLLRKIDGRGAGRLINEVIELIRSLHTGSALIGDPGMPRFLQDISTLISEAAECINPEVLAKARIALAEDREAIGGAALGAMSDHPQLWIQQARRWSDMVNPGLRLKSRRLSALEELPEDEFVEAVQGGVADVDIQEAAEIMNMVSILYNRIRSSKPEIMKQVAEQFVNALDLYELEDMAGGITSDLADSFRPVGRAVMPHVVNAACRMMAPADDEYEEAMAAARVKLRGLFFEKEVEA